jgi:hypothetical protein
MADGIVNPDLTLIPDKAEVWVILKSDVTSPAALIPAAVGDDLLALDWEFGGYVLDTKGISISPSVEFKEYDAFGHPRFRTKTKKGKIDTGFTLLETNETTRKIVLPGSAPNKIGIPKDVQVYVLYKYVDEDRTTIWVQLRPAAIEQTGDSGIVEGELRWFEMTVHHTADANGDVFEIVTDSTTTGWLATLGTQSSGTFTLTWGGNTTTGIAYNAASSAVKAALVALDDGYDASDWTVTGSAGGPYTVTPPVATAVTGSGASLTTPGNFVVTPV